MSSARIDEVFNQVREREERGEANPERGLHDLEQEIKNAKEETARKLEDDGGMMPSTLTLRISGKEYKLEEPNRRKARTMLVEIVRGFNITNEEELKHVVSNPVQLLELCNFATDFMCRYVPGMENDREWVENQEELPIARAFMEVCRFVAAPFVKSGTLGTLENEG